MRDKIALVCHKEEKEILVLLFNMLQPVVQMIKTGPRIDAIYEDADLDVSHKEVRQVFYLTFSRCVPNFELNLVFLPTVVHLNELLEVAHEFCGRFVALALSLDKSSDDTCLADGLVSHEDYFG